MSNLLALNIKANGKTKHVGKVGVCPKDVHDALTNQPVIYKEVISKDFFCRSTHSYSIDKAGMDYAVNELGAKFLVVFIQDQSSLLFVEASLVQSSPVVDLGERAQYRFLPAKCHYAQRRHRIQMGWTNRERLVDAEPFGNNSSAADILGGGAFSLFHALPSNEDSNGTQGEMEREQATNGGLREAAFGAGYSFSN